MKVLKPPTAERDVIKSSTSAHCDVFNLLKLFVYTGSSIRPGGLCPVTMETQTLRLRICSMTKHSRLIDGGDELKWLDTLKQPIKCMLGNKGEEKDAGFRFSWFLSTFAY